MTTDIAEQYFELRRLKEAVDADRAIRTEQENAGIINEYAKAVDTAFERITAVIKDIDRYEQQIVRRKKCLGILRK